jgi:hypothetical protein
MSMRRVKGLIPILGCSFLWTAAAYAQFGRGMDWTTAGSDAQRSSWVRTDPKISVERMQKPGFALAWKIKLNGEPGVAATLDRYIGYRGFRSFAFTNSAAGEMTAIDTDLGRVEWRKKLEGGAAKTAGACSGGMTSNVARPSTVAFPAAPAGRGGGMGGRGGPAKSDVGQPGEGAVTITAALDAGLRRVCRAAQGAAGACSAGPIFSA